MNQMVKLWKGIHLKAPNSSTERCLRPKKEGGKNNTEVHFAAAGGCENLDSKEKKKGG